MTARRAAAVGRVAVRPVERPRPLDGGAPAPEAAPTALRPGAAAVEALRRRLAGTTARDHVVLDFLDDDLREAKGAITSIAAWVARVETALADDAAPQEKLLSLALGGGPIDHIDYLAEVLASARRRVAQVAARM
jgi:hypothetical protein